MLCLTTMGCACVCVCYYMSVCVYLCLVCVCERQRCGCMISRWRKYVSALVCVHGWTFLSVGVWFRLCWVMWAHCACTFVGVQSSMCSSRDFWEYQCLVECVRMSIMFPKDICQYLVGLGYVGRVSKRRRTLSVTLGLFTGWQMITRLWVANNLEGVSLPDSMHRAPDNTKISLDTVSA